MPRNTLGTYTLPSGNPVMPGTLIQSSWANSTLSDVANELTNSLDRQGRGGMLVPFKNSDGTLLLPGMTWQNETSSGFARLNPAEISVITAATLRAKFGAGGLNIVRPLQAGGALGLAFVTQDTSKTWNVYNPIASTDLRISTPTVPDFVSMLESGLFRINGNAAAFAGALPATARLHVVGADTEVTRVVVDAVGGNTTFQGRRANGTLAAPTAPLANDGLATFAAGGYTGAAWATAASAGMVAYAAENWSAAALGSYLTWETTSVGATARAERMRLTDIGHLGLGTSPSAWTSTYRALEFLNGCSLFNFQGAIPSLSLISNAYYDGATFRYKIANAAALYSLQEGRHLFSGAAAGVPGAAFSFTTHLQIAANGAISAGTTSAPAYGSLLRVQGGIEMFDSPQFNFAPTGAVHVEFVNRSSGGFTFYATPSLIGLNITPDGRVYGRALHNNAGSLAGAVNQYLGSGTYTPVAVVTAGGMTGVTLLYATYKRVGNVVSVTGSLSANGWVSGVTSSLRMTLPIASAFSTSQECSGLCTLGSSVGFPCGYVGTDSANDQATLVVVPNSSGNFAMTFSFQYEVK